MPLYLGAPNIAEFAPGDHCYINVDHFGSVKALAEFLLELDADDDRFAEYFKWKELPNKDGFAHRLKQVEKDPLIRFCELIREKTASRE